MRKGKYSYMRLFVMFDMPMKTKRDIKNYTLFRKSLIQEGYMMFQYSIYTRFIRNHSDLAKHVRRLEDMKPKKGNIKILQVTENQYENIINLSGKRVDDFIGSNNLIVIE